MDMHIELAPEPAPPGSVPSVRTGTDASETTVGHGTSHAKAVLFGEHAVVYGQPAIAVPLPQLDVQATVSLTGVATDIDSEPYTGPLTGIPQTLSPTATALSATLAAFDAAHRPAHLRIRSAIPSERGLGSSAAVAAAVVGAACDALGIVPTATRRYELVQVAERAAHGSPSGIDARAVLADAPIWFRRGLVESVAVRAPLSLVVVDTGIRGGTREAVEAVRDRRDGDLRGTDALIRALGALSEDARGSLRAGDLAAIGAQMTEAHGLLARLGVSHERLDALAQAALDRGAWGAKMTGGGRGGCLIALAADDAAAEQLASDLREVGAAGTWPVRVEARG